MWQVPGGYGHRRPGRSLRGPQVAANNREVDGRCSVEACAAAGSGVFLALSCWYCSVALLSARLVPSRRRFRTHSQRVSIVRFTATPSALSASGGELRLRAVVHGARKCRFSSARTLKGFPYTKGCASGRASVNIKLAKNKTSSTETYRFALTASGARGVSTKRRA